MLDYPVTVTHVHVMKNERYMDEHDRVELEEAKQLISTGQKMRRRVMSRLTTRAWRERSNDK